jgi:hypothetical protein
LDITFPEDQLSIFVLKFVLKHSVIVDHGFKFRERCLYIIPLVVGLMVGHACKGSLVSSCKCSIISCSCLTIEHQCSSLDE